MLQAHYDGPLGYDVQLLDGQLGFSITGAFKTVGGALKSGASAVGGGIVDSANAVGSGIIQAGKALPSAAGAIAKGACGLVSNSSIQQGASIASKVPNPYAQGVSKGIAVGAGICNMAFPPKTPQMPTQTAGKTGVLPKMKVAQVLQAKSKLPPGSIQWQSSKTGQWIYAIPKGSALGMPVIDALNGMGLGAQGFISPWLKPGKFTSPYDIPPGQFKKAYWRRQYNWYDTNTADAPYRATWGISATHTVAGGGASPDPGATTVTEKAGKKATAPFYKKWWFWLAVAGGTAALGTGAYLIFRRK